MENRRLIIIIAAVVIGLAAAGGAYSYLNSTQNRANKGAKLVQVFVVKTDIPKGTTGDDAISKGLIKSSQISEKVRPLTALVTLDSIRGKVALTTLPVNQVVVDGQFVAPAAAQTTFAQRIPADQVAVTLNFDQLHAVGGLVAPGDRVDIMLVTGAGAQILYQNVNILAIGTSPAPQAGEAPSVVAPGAGSGLITFAVPAEAAERLTIAGGTMYLLLVAPDNKARPVGPANQGNLLQVPLTPYG
ncbi:MAG: Flp pilus assembly protein CpaB [Actinobacteria bacterium]|nr:MAG: Flp pilus assembly protein CpaB [Actinomycetota bacterium]